MNAEYWTKRWQIGETKFDELSPHRFLVKHYPKLNLEHQGPVFVPLCGKSVDMQWLHEQGREVIGVELSEIAIKQFFDQIALWPTITKQGQHQCYQAIGYTIYQGDLFELSALTLQSVNAVYDRAALIALPQNMRRRYADFFNKNLPSGCQLLLITMDLDQGKKPGPPSVVTTEEVHQLFAKNFNIELLETEKQLSVRTDWQAIGVEEVVESVYLLTKF